MRKDEKIRFISVFLINILHVIVQDGADAGAAGKKIFSHINFSFNIALRNQFSILACKRKWFYLVQHLEFFIPIPRYHCFQYEEKTYNKYCKKNKVKYPLFAHVHAKLQGLVIA